MWNSGLRLLLYSAVFTAFALLLSSIEPFGLDEVVEDRSRDVAYRSFAAAYDGFSTDATQFTRPLDTWEDKPRPPGASGPAREKILKVFVDEEVIFQMREGDVLEYWSEFRPSLFAHADIANNIARLYEGFSGRNGEATLKAPPAVFFDFLFVERGVEGTETAEAFDFFVSMLADITRAEVWGSDPGCVDPIDRLVCIRHAGGIPLIYARPVEVVGASAPELLDDVVILAPVRYSGLGDGYPLQFDVDGRPEATPAALLYLAWCMANTGSCSTLEPPPGVTGRARLDAMAETFRSEMTSPMSVVWGSGVPDDFTRGSLQMANMRPGAVLTGALGDEYYYAEDVPVERRSPELTSTCRLDGGIASIWKLFIRQIFGASASSGSLIQRCPYHMEVPYSAVGLNAVDQTLAERLFDGRVIVVGGQFKNAPDWEDNIVHGRTFGMRKHAMATDNLITFHDGYLKAPVSIAGTGLDGQDLFDAATLFVIVLVGGIGQLWVNKRLIAQATASAREEKPSHWIVYVAMLVAALVLTILSIIVAVWVLRIEPPNWIGHIVLAVTFYIYLLRDEFFDDVGRLVRRSRRIGGSTLVGLRWWMRYFNLETLGFERRTRPEDLADAKARVVAKLYAAPAEAKQPTLSASVAGAADHSSSDLP